MGTPKATETDKTVPEEKPKTTEADKTAPAENSEGAMSSKDEERKVEKKLKLYLAFDPFLGPFLFVKDDNGKIVLII